METKFRQADVCRNEVGGDTLMERKLEEPKGTLHQWIAADEHDLKVTEIEAADGLLDWDPWWPVTAKPRGRPADGEGEQPSEPPTAASGVGTVSFRG